MPRLKKKPSRARYGVFSFGVKNGFHGYARSLARAEGIAKAVKRKSKKGVRVRIYDYDGPGLI